MAMGMNGQNDYAGSRYRTSTSLAEINVTPLVDVMLVLLIVFMVSAPLMQQGIQVDLPKTSSPTLDDQQDQIVLVIAADKSVSINKNDIPMADLKAKLGSIYKNKSSREIFIQADQHVAYGFVAQVMSEVKRAGITKVGLVTEPPK